ncbi:MAG TPA: hypothetical protein VFB69_03765 [Candidatus Dormibacteraeota bacterium]|nr:hypothetical protein [Candidatus Dormibacteraeota bacterium]
MSSQSRSKQTIRGAKTGGKSGSKGARRTPGRSTETPYLAFIVGGILLLLFVGLFIYGAINNKSTGTPSVQGSKATISCDALERTQVHYHVGIQVVLHGTPETNFLTPGAGIQGGETAPTCFYWLHVHSANANTIHIESPAADVFTLGDWFKVWDTWSTLNGQSHEKLSSTQVGQYKLQTGDEMKVYVDLNDGKGPQLYDGDPTSILLKAHEVITIVIGPPDLQPSDGRFPQFTFAQGL